MQSTGQFPAAGAPSGGDPRAGFQGREIQPWQAGGPTGFAGQSSYTETYRAHPIDPRQPVLPPGATGAYGGAGAFSGTSSYKQDYPQHPMQARPPPPGSQYAPNAAPFDGTTAYRETYKPHAIDPSATAAGRANGGRGAYNPSTAPFEGNSSYKSDYTQHPLGTRQQAHPSNQYQPNAAPFDGTSHYKTDYPPRQVEPRAPILPVSNAHPPAPFEGQTHYRQDYPAHPMEARPPPPSNAYTPNSAPFEGSTTTRDAYQPWPVDPAATQRRGGPPPMQPSAPFDGSSTYKQQFQGWKLPPRRPALGVQMVGDRTCVLIPAEAPLPATGRSLFTTVHDNQSEICVLVLRGDAAVASRNNVIGSFNLNGLPPGPKGSARIEVTFNLDADNVLSATATDLDANRQEQWLRQGSMTAHTHATDVQVV